LSNKNKQNFSVEFVRAAAKGEEMYHPETFGRTGTDFVKVE